MTKNQKFNVLTKCSDRCLYASKSVHQLFLKGGLDEFVRLICVGETNEFPILDPSPGVSKMYVYLQQSNANNNENRKILKCLFVFGKFWCTRSTFVNDNSWPLVKLSSMRGRLGGLSLLALLSVKKSSSFKQTPLSLPNSCRARNSRKHLPIWAQSAKAPANSWPQSDTLE